MINKLSSLISSKFVEHNIISKSVKDVYRYGIEITISSIIGFVITCLIGLLFRMLMQTMLFYVIFILLRSMTGGYHAKTYLKCNFIFSIITLFIVTFSKAAYEMQISFGILTLLFLPSIAIFIWIAPVENVNKPIKAEKRVYWKSISIVTSVLLYLLSLLLYKSQHTLEATVIVITIFSVSILCMIPIIQKGGKSNG
jgi:accessory gene regulator B